MRNLRINKRSLYYAQYAGKTEAVDADGNYTGDIVISYTAPVELRCNISPAKGASAIGMFGINFDYSKTVSVDERNCPMCETSAVWLNLPPNIVAFDQAKTYPEGAYAIHDSKMWKCVTAITEAETWTAAHWEEVPHNYVVTLVAVGLESTMYALKEVD